MHIRKATADDANTIEADLLVPAFEADERRDPEWNTLDEEGVEQFGCEYWLEDED